MTKTYLISRGWHACQSIEIEADSEEEAIAKAKEEPDSHWEDCGGDDEILYQSEGEL